MRASDYLEEIVWSFRKQKLRTFLTATGIGIGAFALALMVALGAGLQAYIEAQIKAFGDPRILMVLPGVAKAGGKILDQLQSFGKPAEPLTDDEERDKKNSRGGVWITAEQSASLRAMKGVQSVAPFVGLDVDGVRLAAEPAAPEGKWYRVDFASLTSNPIMGTLSRGRVAIADAQEIVLSPQYAQSFSLPGDALLGKTVELRVPKLSNVASRFIYRDPTKFKDERSVFKAVVVGLAEESPLSRVVYASIGLGKDMARYQSQNPDLLSDDKIGFQAIVRVAPDADPKLVKADVEKLGLMARSTDEELKTVSQLFLVIDSFLTVFGLIALFVATFGIANTLLMAITERTREIGVMKALGATKRTIRLLFAAEAAAIGVVGGVGGVGFAMTVAQIANVIAHRMPVGAALKGYSVFVFPWWLVLGSVLFATLVGVLAGIYPASRAAGLDPIEALRHE